MILNKNSIVWEENILASLKDLANVEFQKQAWTGNLPGLVSSFVEIINTLYDSFDFERFIKDYKSIKGEDALYLLLSELDEMISLYEELETDELTLNDPKWIAIANKAGELVCTWESIERKSHP